jgi:hypothetical protein
MSVSWTVIPFRSDLPDFIEWLQKEGMNVSFINGRFPTMVELFDALRIFEGHTAGKYQISNDLWEVIVGEPHSGVYAHMLGSVKEGGFFNFHFWGSWCQDTTMIAILKQLSIVCGPFVWFDHYSVTPLIVTPDIDIHYSLQDWNKRAGNDE